MATEGNTELEDGPRATQSHSLPVVGLGASAGGIEAFTEFFSIMPGDSGAAFVLVLHLDPNRESQLSSVLAHHTTMPVTEIIDGMEIQPNHVYVIAPAFDVTLVGNTLRLSKPAEPRGHTHPVDALFRSLAAQRAERAVAIVLSGTGTNGTQGLREIKAAGGLILVENPSNARFDGMPRSAIRAGLADRVLAPDKMPAIVVDYLRHNYLAEPDGLQTSPLKESSSLDQLLGLLRLHSGQEFRDYKPATLLRRINRRMSLNNLKTFAAYIGLLSAQPDELRALVRDLLINVTDFFRDPEAWATLDELVVTPLVKNRESDASLRVWVPACATGEEAYSIAMLLMERAELARKNFDIKIFASDVLDENLNTGRAGIYTSASVEMMSPERVRKFFERVDGSYQVRKALRDVVVFARQNLLNDPPFSRMDLVSCRNMLIYIKPEAQARTLALFHFALRAEGHLFLGSAETVGRADDVFETRSKKWRIFRRGGAMRHAIPDFPMFGNRAADSPRTDAIPTYEPSARVTEAARRALLERYAPASVLIDQKGNVLYFHGETGDYLKQPSGEPTRDFLAMVARGLLPSFRNALPRIFADHQQIEFTGWLRHAAVPRQIRVRLLPLAGQDSLVLVTFEPLPDDVAPAAQKEHSVLEDASALEFELKSTRADLRGTIEQLEGVNEELKAANEEATSINEELQSTNEELETSKEELQSFNEELHSVNGQLQHKINELDQSTNDLANLLAGTEIATLFLDMECRVKWFSPATKQLIDLVTSDIGRPLRHFARKFDDDRLLDDADAVLAKLTPMEAEIQSHEGRWFVRRILPYRTQDNRISGLIITFVDITDRRKANDAVNEARIYAEAIVSNARQPFIVLDAQLRVRSANRSFYTLFNMNPDGTEHHRLDEAAGSEWNNPELHQLLNDVLQRDQQFEDVEIRFGPPGPAQKTMLLNARKLKRDGGREDLILLAIENITERKSAAVRHELLIGELNHRVKNVLANVQAVMNQTLRQSASLEDFTTAFVGRLHALAQAHDLLAAEAWVGTEMGQILSRTLEPYRLRDGARIAATGPYLPMRPQVGVALVMVFHELATNAAKYGALSASSGTLTVTWCRYNDAADERIRVLWVEAGGPKVVQPSRRGFGTRLIERSVRNELGGEARLEYLEDGVRCELTFPWSSVAPTFDHRG